MDIWDQADGADAAADRKRKPVVHGGISLGAWEDEDLRAELDRREAERKAAEERAAAELDRKCKEAIALLTEHGFRVIKTGKKRKKAVAS